MSRATAKSAPQVSVVVPAYNGGAQFARRLDALLASDCPSFQIVVADDGSTDASAGARERVLSRPAHSFARRSFGGATPAAFVNLIEGAAGGRGRGGTVRSR